MDEVGEAELLDSGRQGRILDCSAGTDRRPVDAALLRRCCLDFRDQIDPRGLRLHRAAVRGPVDLAGLTLPFPLRFEGCDFDSPVHVEGAELRDLALTGCDPLPGLLGNGLRLRGDLDLSRSSVTGAHRTSASLGKRSAVWLCEARIGGRRCARPPTRASSTPPAARWRAPRRPPRAASRCRPTPAAAARSAASAPSCTPSTRWCRWSAWTSGPAGTRTRTSATGP